MGRIGLSYIEVADACDALAAEGHTPTIDRVVGLLKTTASRTTVSNHLKNWRSLRERNASSRLPEPLSALISDQTRHIYASIEAAVGATFQKERQDLLANISALEAEVDLLQDGLATKDGELAAKSELVDTLKADGQRTAAALANATQQLSETQSALDTARGRMAAMSEQLTVMHEQQASLVEQLASQAAKVDRLASTLDQLGAYVAGVGGDLVRLRSDQAETAGAVKEVLQLLRPDPGLEARGLVMDRIRRR
jgi:chromosome segregation ATPase